MLLSCAFHNAREALRSLVGGQSSAKALRIRTHCLPTLRSVTTTSVCWHPAEITPLRKQLKDEAKVKKGEVKNSRAQDVDSRLAAWELTVGIEIHAQLNTARKLFSCPFPHINRFMCSDSCSRLDLGQRGAKQARRAV